MLMKSVWMTILMIPVAIVMGCSDEIAHVPVSNSGQGATAAPESKRIEIPTVDAAKAAAESDKKPGAPLATLKPAESVVVVGVLRLPRGTSAGGVPTIKFVHYAADGKMTIMNSASAKTEKVDGNDMPYRAALRGPDKAGIYFIQMSYERRLVYEGKIEVR